MNFNVNEIALEYICTIFGIEILFLVNIVDDKQPKKKRMIFWSIRFLIYIQNLTRLNWKQQQQNFIIKKLNVFILWRSQRKQQQN